MNVPQKQSKLLDAIAKLEWCLETPLVPGELERWTTAVQQSLGEVKPLLGQVVAVEHHQKMDQISQEDPGLLRRVAQMTEQDQENLENLIQVHQQLEQLSTRAELVEPDEGRLKDRFDKFVDNCLAFVINVRKQEAAIDTWSMEALDRDRGVVD